MLDVEIVTVYFLDKAAIKSCGLSRSQCEAIGPGSLTNIFVESLKLSIDDGSILPLNFSCFLCRIL